MSILRYPTPASWAQAVLADFDAFLVDHAAAEKKASSMAMTMISHYPDRPELILAMTDLAVEELNHFKEVVKIIYNRGIQLASDEKDPYIVGFRQSLRQGKETYLLDRLLIAGIIEARGHERFGLIADALEPGPLKKFYQAITQSESRHYQLFFDLAKRYLPSDEVEERLNELLDIEAKIVESLPIRAMLH